MTRNALSAALLMVALVVPGFASASPSDPLQSLPAGDFVLSLDSDAVVNRIAPVWLVGNPDKMKELDEWLRQASSITGLDPRSIRSIHVSAKDGMVSGSDMTMLLDAKFDPKDLQATWQSRGLARTETYQSTTINVLGPSGSTRIKSELAVAIIDPHTVVVGTVDGVRRTVDVRGGRGISAAADKELASLYNSTDSRAQIRMAARLSPADTRARLEREPGDPGLMALSKVRYVFGSVNATEGMAMRLTARAESSADAKALVDNVAALVSVGQAFAGQNAKYSRYGALLKYITVTSSGNDANVSVNIPQDVVQGAFTKK